MDLTLGHVESGLRSYDWSMPEEHNRVMLDRISDYLFAPTAKSAKILAEERVGGAVHVTGNTIVDAMYYAEKQGKLVRPKCDDLEKEFALLTSHRQENVDNETKLIEIVKAIELVAEKIQVIFPIHPRTQKMLCRFQLMDWLTKIRNVKLMDPLPYVESLWAIRNASVVLTDSGGLQEEACIMGTPCVTLRENTERPESVEVGANIIAGVSAASIYEAFEAQLQVRHKDEIEWANPFGDGHAATRIARIVS
jgi:UDP-N-acetylglucosamine 2-epimerase (non-hydrolysing)